MKKYKSERIQLLHDKLVKHKDDILKDKAEGASNNELARKYGINAFTLCDYIYLWKHGVKRRRVYQMGIRPERGVRKFKKKEFSQQLKSQMKINSEINKRLIKRVKVNNGQDEQMIRYICGVKV